ncbi:hypothetical protein F5Y15DRAFT_169474 [Xylariaceae sp. FL0016]|nr:hypothetical protein F5Y15DRAFT_169474 [Xylariaceae sp. FL0016]
MIVDRQVWSSQGKAVKDKEPPPRMTTQKSSYPHPQSESGPLCLERSTPVSSGNIARKGYGAVFIPPLSFCSHYRAVSRGKRPCPLQNRLKVDGASPLSVQLAASMALLSEDQASHVRYGRPCARNNNECRNLHYNTKTGHWAAQRQPEPFSDWIKGPEIALDMGEDGSWILVTVLTGKSTGDDCLVVFIACGKEGWVLSRRFG